MGPAKNGTSRIRWGRHEEGKAKKILGMPLGSFGCKNRKKKGPSIKGGAIIGVSKKRN